MTRRLLLSTLAAMMLLLPAAPGAGWSAAAASPPDKPSGPPSLPPAPAPNDGGLDGDVLGGTPVPPGAHPYFATVWLNDNFLCGGVLLSPTVVATSFHCLAELEEPLDAEVVLGATSLSDAGGEVRGVASYHYAPGAGSGTCYPTQRDLAVLVLEHPSTQPWTRLADPSPDVPVGASLVALGHGQLAEDEPSDDLLARSLTVRSESGLPGCTPPTDVIVAGTEGVADVCNEDIGGPLLRPNGETHAPVAGLISEPFFGCEPSLDYHAQLYAGSLRAFVESHVVRPLNDAFTAATPLSGSAGSVPGDTTAATAETGEPLPGGPEATVWYSWTAPSNAPVTFDVNTLGSSFPVSWDSTLGVYTGSSVAALSQVAYNDDFALTRESRVTFTPVAGTTYRIRVDAYSLANPTSPPSSLTWGPFRLGWSQQRPANDDFADAISLTTATGQTVQSVAKPTHQPGEPDIHVTDSDSSVWYRWTPPVGGSATVSLAGSAFDTTLAVYTGSGLGTLTLVGSNDDVHPPARESKVDFTAVAGTAYWIAVDEFLSGDPEPDSLVLQWSAGRPANDDVSAARIISAGSGTIGGTTIAATGEPGERAPVVDPADRSVWYRWTAPSTGEFVFGVATDGTWDPQLGVWDGPSPPSHVALAADDDSGPGSDPRLTLAAVAGTTYWVQVEARDASGGPFTLTWSTAVAPPTCGGLAATIVGSGVITGTAGNDVIVGSTGADTINGLGGDDVICGLDGPDTVLAGTGNDVVIGGAGDDAMHGGPGDDVLNGGSGADTASWAASASGVQADLAAGTASGEGADSLVSVERLVGSAHADVLLGNGLANVILGGAGPDLIEGNSGDDQLFGEGGPDDLRGGPGGDLLDGGAAADVLRGDDGDDTLLGGAQVDTVSYRNAPVAVTVDLAAGTATGQGSDAIGADVEDILGSQHDDTLSGNVDDNKIQGLGGRDVIDGRDGDDDLRGNGKDDTIVGGNGNDRVHGGSGADNLTGGSGDDEMIGSTGTPDTCDGGPGTDTHGGGCETLIGIP